MQFKATISAGASGYASFIPITEEQAKHFLNQKIKRLMVTINKDLKLHRAIQRSNEFGYYIMTGKGLLKEAGLEIGQTVEVKLEKDTTELKSLIPEALDAVLKSDFEAFEAFEKLRPGKKRTIIYLVTGVKSEQKQVERALKIMENIKIGITDPKLLLK